MPSRTSSPAPPALRVARQPSALHCLVSSGPRNLHDEPPHPVLWSSTTVRRQTRPLVLSGWATCRKAMRTQRQKNRETLRRTPPQVERTAVPEGPPCGAAEAPRKSARLVPEGPPCDVMSPTRKKARREEAGAEEVPPEGARSVKTSCHNNSRKDQRARTPSQHLEGNPHAREAQPPLPALGAASPPGERGQQETSAAKEMPPVRGLRAWAPGSASAPNL